MSLTTNITNQLSNVASSVRDVTANVIVSLVDRYIRVNKSNKDTNDDDDPTINYPSLVYIPIRLVDVNGNNDIYQFDEKNIMEIFEELNDIEEFNKIKFSNGKLVNPNDPVVKKIYEKFKTQFKPKEINGNQVFVEYLSSDEGGSIEPEKFFINFLKQFRKLFNKVKMLQYYNLLNDPFYFSYDSSINKDKDSLIKAIKKNDLVGEYFLTKKQYDDIKKKQAQAPPPSDPDAIKKASEELKTSSNMWNEKKQNLTKILKQMLESEKLIYNSMSNLPFVVFFNNKTILELEKSPIIQKIDVNKTDENQLNTQNEIESLNNLRDLFFGFDPKKKLVKIVELLKLIIENKQQSISFEHFMIITDYLNGLNNAIKTATGLMESPDKLQKVWVLDFVAKHIYKYIVNTTSKFLGEADNYKLPYEVQNDFIEKRDEIYKLGNNDKHFEAYSTALIAEIRESMGLKKNNTNNQKKPIDTNKYAGIKIIENYRNMVFNISPFFKTSKNNTNDQNELYLDEASIVKYWMAFFKIPNEDANPYDKIKEGIYRVFFQNITIQQIKDNYTFYFINDDNNPTPSADTTSKNPLNFFDNKLKEQLQDEFKNFASSSETVKNKLLIKLCYYLNKNRFDKALLAVNGVLASIPEIVNAKNIKDAVAKNPFKMYYQLSKNEYKPEELFLNSLIEQFQTYAPQDIFSLEECIVLTTPDRKVFFCGFKENNKDMPTYIPNNLLLGDNPFLTGGEQFRPEVPAQMAYAILDKIIKAKDDERFVVGKNILIDKKTLNLSTGKDDIFYINKDFLINTIEQIINEKTKKDKNQNNQNNKNDDLIDLNKIDRNTLIENYNPFKLFIRFNQKSSKIANKSRQNTRIHKFMEYVRMGDKYVFDFGTVDKDGTLVSNQFDRMEVTYDKLKEMSKQFCQENGVCTSNIEYTITQKGYDATDEMIKLQKNPENTTNTKRGGRRIHNIKNNKPQLKKQENKKTRKNGKK